MGTLYSKGFTVEQLYHVIGINNAYKYVIVITEVLSDDCIRWGYLKCDGYGIAFNIFECKRLIELAKQEDSLSTFAIEYTYEIIPAKIY